MNRRLTFLIGALQAAMAVAIGLGVTLVPFSIVWLFENDPTISWMVAYRTSADIWLLSQGARIVVPAGEIVGMQVPTFVLSLMPLGMTIFLGWLAYRVGRRLSAAPEIWPAWIGSLVIYGGASFALGASAFDKAIYPVEWQATFFPPIFFMALVFAGSLFGKKFVVYDSSKFEAAERVRARAWFEAKFENLPWVIRTVWQPALRAGTAVVVSLIVVSAIAIAVMLAFNWIPIAGFYESLQVSVLGGILVTVAQLLILPNLVIFGAAWLTGAGFSIGEGSLISPLGSATGPLPTIPVLAALPQGTLSFGMVAIVIPLVATLFATTAIKKFTKEIRFEFASSLAAALTLGISVAVVATVEMGILGLLASGAVGPGRLSLVGVNVLILMAVVFVEVAAVAIVASFYSARPDRPDHPLIATLKRK